MRKALPFLQEAVVPQITYCSDFDFIARDESGLAILSVHHGVVNMLQYIVSGVYGFR